MLVGLNSVFTIFQHVFLLFLLMLLVVVIVLLLFFLFVLWTAVTHDYTLLNWLIVSVVPSPALHKRHRVKAI